MKGEHKSKTEMKTSTVKTRTETKSTRSIERKAQRTTITTSSVTEKKTDIKSSPTTPKKSVEHKVNGVAPKPEPMKHARPSSRTRPSPTSTPAKSAKEANNRKVVESKYHISKASKLTTSKAAKKEVQEPAAKAERKPVSRRPKATPSSPAKIAAKSPGSPAKSSSAKSTPTPSVKSEKEAVIRKRKVETGKITADSSAVSTPSTTEVETVVKAKEIGKAQDTPLVNGHISEMIITKEDISKELLDKPLEETYVEKKTEKIDSETIRKSPTDDQQEVTETEDKTSVREKEIKDIPTIEGKEKQMDEETVEKEVEVEEKEMVVEDKESEIEEKETELEEKESEIEEKESEVEEGDDSRQLIHEKEDVEATEEEQTEEIEDEEGPVDIKESLHAELETEVKKLMREKIEGGEEEEEEEEGGGTEEEEEEQEEEQEGDEDEEDEYLIVEKEDVESYQEQESIESHLPDDFDNKDIDVEEEDEGELQKHLLDEVETEKTKKDIEKEEMDTKMHREVESQKEHLIKEKEVDITLKSKAEKEITETEKMKEEHVEEIKEQETEGVTEETAKPLKEEITKDHIEEKVEEIISSAKEIVTKGKFEDERKPGVSQESDKDIQKEELSESKKEPETSEDLKEISSISPEEKIDVSSEKVRETTDTDHKLDDGGHEMKEIPSKEILEQKFIAEESQPDEKVSTTIESAATTAPTLPEDERIPLDEIKEIVEEKYVKEETKEKEKPVAEAVTRLEQPTTLPQVVMPIFETHIAHGIIHQRDIVKTPDEVADLPVHEEVDPGMYDADDFVRDFHKTKYEVQLSKKQQDTEEIKDYIPEVGAAEERLKIDTGKADTLKESLKQFEDEKEVEEVKIAPEERFVDEIEDIIHVKREISDVAKPSVKPVSVAQLEEPMPKEDMAKPTDESKPVTVISEEKLLEATFQTYADLKATKEKVDELKEKFSEEGKKAVEKEIDYAAILEKDIAHDRVALQEMREEKKTEGEEIGAEYISSEKKYIEEQLETISDQLKQKEKVISEEISTLQQTYVKEMPEVKGKDEMKPLPMDVAQEKMQEEKQKVITEDVTERIEKLEGDKVIQEKKIEKDIKEDVTAEIKEVEDKEKPVPKEMTQEVIMQDEKIISDELVKAKKVAEKDELITDDEEIKKLKEEEVVPKEVIEETIKDKEVSKVMCEEEMKEERVVKEDIIEEIKQLEGKEKSTPKEVLEKKIKEEDETISKAMIEVEEKEEKVDTEDIMAKIPKLEEKDKDVLKEVDDKEKSTQKDVAKDETKVGEEMGLEELVDVTKKREIVTEDTIAAIPKLEDKQKVSLEELDESKTKDKKEEEKEKRIAEEIKKDIVDLEEQEQLLSKDVAKEKPEDKQKEEIDKSLRELEDTEKLSPKEVKEIQISKEKIPEKDTEEQLIVAKYTTEETDKLKEKEKIQEREMVEDKAKEGRKIESEEIIHEKKKDEREVITKDITEKQEEKERLSPREVVEEITVKEEVSVSAEAIQREETIKADLTTEIKKQQEMEKIVSKELVEEKEKESEEKIKAITEDVALVMLKAEEKEKPAPKERAEEKMKEEKLVSKEAAEEDKREDKETVITEDIPEKIKQLEEKEKPAPTEISELKTKEETVVLKEKVVEKKADDRVITEDITKLEVKEKTPSDDRVEIKAEEEIITIKKVDEEKKEEEKAKVEVAGKRIVEEGADEEKDISQKMAEEKIEEKEKVVPEEITKEKKQLDATEKLVSKETSKTKSEDEVTRISKEIDQKMIIEDKKKIVPEITEHVKKQEERDTSLPKEEIEEMIQEEWEIVSKEMIEEEKKDSSEAVTEATVVEIKEAEEKEITIPKEIDKEKIKEPEKIITKDTIVKLEEHKVVTEDITEKLKETEKKEESVPHALPEEKAKEAEKPLLKETIVRKEEDKVITEHITEAEIKPEEKEETVPHEICEEKPKEADTVVKKEEEKVITEDITEEAKKPEEKDKTVPHEIPEDKIKEAEKLAPKETIAKKEEEKVITEDITEEVKKPEEKEKTFPFEILEEKAKEAEKPVSKDTVMKVEEEKVITEDITEEVKKPEEKEEFIPQEIPERKAKEAEKPVSKDTVVKEEEEKVVTEDITEEVKKPEEKEKTVSQELLEEKAKEAEKPVSKDTLVKEEEEKIVTEDITEEVKKPEEKEKSAPQEILEEKAKEAEKPVSKDTVVKEEEEKIVTEDITEEVKKPEEKEKSAPQEILEEKAKEAEKPVSKDTVVKEEEEKIVTEDITEEVKKPEEKEKSAPQEILEEKAKEAEKPVSKDTVVKEEEEKVITEDITEKVKKPEEKEEAVPHEIPKEKAKEVEKPVLKDTTVTKEEEKVITDYISEEVKKPEDKEEAVPHEIPKEKAKEAEKPVSKDTVLKKEEEKVITEDITEVKKPEEKEKPVPYEIVEEKSKEVGKADLKDTTEKIKEDRSQDLEKEKLISKDIDEQYIVSPEKGEEGKKPSLGDMPSSEEFVEERRKVEEKSSTPEITEKKDDVKDVPLSEKMVEKERYISEDLLEEKKEGEEKEEVVPKDLIKEGEKVDTIHIDHTEKEKEIDEREKTITEKIIEEKKKEVGEESIIVKDSVEHEKKGEPIAVEDITSVIGKEEPKKDKAASKELLEEKKEEKGRERAITDISKEKEGQQETEKITSKQLIEKVGMEETTAKLAPKYVVAEKEKDQVISKAVTEEKIDDLEKRKIVTTYEKISDKIETIFDIKTDLSLQETSQPTATTAKEVKPAEVIKTNGELEKSEQKVPQVKMHGETAIKGEPEDKVDQKMEPGKETITAPSALSATYLEIIDKLQKEEPSEVDKQEDEESPKREELQVSEADKSLRKEVSKTMEELEEISVTSSQMSDIKHLSQEGVKPEITKDSHRKEEEQMSEEKPSLQEQELISKKDKAEIGVEKEDKKVKVEADSLETEKTSATIEWLTCVVKDTKPSLGEEQEEIFKKVVSTKEKKVTETEDQIDEKKVKEKQQEIEKTVKDTDIMSVITERQKTLPDSETSKEIPTSIEQKKQPTGEREIIDKSIEVVKSQPKYEADRPAETFSEVYQEDKKDELAKSVSSEKEKQLTDEEEKKQKTERLLLETEGSIISKDLAETITTTVMKEYILKTTHITSDSVTSDVPAPGKIPVQPSVEPEITPLQEKVEIKETGLSPKVEDTDKRAADTLISHELKDTEKISAGQEIGKEKQLGISEETTVSKVKEVSKEVKYDGITSKLPTSAADHRSDDEDGEPPPSPGEEYIDSGMEEEPVYTKLDAPELPEYVTVTPDSTPASPKALPLRPQDDSAKMHLPGSEEKERKEKLKYEHTETDKKEPAKVTTTALPQEKEVEYRMYVDDTGDKTGEPGEVIADEDGHIVTRRTRTEYKTIVTREGKPDEKTVSSLMAGSVTPISSGEITGVKDDKLSDEEHLEEIDDDSKESVSEETFTDEDGKTVTRKIVRRYKTVVTSRTESAEEKGIMKEIQPSFSSEAGPGSFIPVSSGEITTYTTVVKGDRLSDEEHLEEIDDDSKESVSEETFTDEDGKIVTRKVVRRYKTVVTSRTESADEKGEIKEFQPPFSSEAGPMVLPSSSKTTTTTTKVIEGHEYPLDTDKQDDKAAVSEETFTDKDGKTVTRRTVRHYRTYITQSTGEMEPTHIKTDDRTPLEPAQDVDESKTRVTVSTDKAGTEEIMEFDDDDEKESVTEETFTDEEGRTVTRRVIRRYKTVITKEREVVDEKPTTKLVTTIATKKTETKEGDDIDDGVEMEECTELSDQDEKESVSEETFTDESGKTVTRKIVRRYKTVVTRGSESVDTKDSIKLPPKEAKGIVDEIETEQADLDDQDEKESVTEETFTDESGRTVTRKVVRRYKTVMTKESSSVGTEESSQVRATDIIHSELSPTALTQKMYTTVIKSDDDRDDGVETDKLDELDDQDEKESVSEETFTDESGKTVTRKIVRRYKTVVTKGSESIGTKDTTKLTPKVAKSIGDETETERTDLDDQDEKESVTEETFTDGSGRTVTRKIVRRYKTVVTKESSSVGAEDSRQIRATDITASELSPDVLTQKTYTTVIKSDDDRDDGVETDKLDEFDDQDEKESVSEETFTDESGKTVTRKIVRRYKTVVTRGSESVDTKDSMKLAPKEAKDIVDEIETEQDELDDQDEKESVTEETFTDENGRVVTRKIVRRYKTVITKESSSVDAEDSSQMRATDTIASELSPTVLTRKTYTTVIKSDDDRDDGVETDKLEEFDDQDENESVSEETFTDEGGRTVRRKIIRHYKTVIRQEGEPTDAKDSTTIKMEKISAPDLTLTATTSESCMTDVKEGVGVDDGIEISDQDGKESVTEETFTDENGRIVTRKIVRRYKTVVTKESGSLEDKGTSETEKKDVRDMERMSTAFTTDTHTTALGVIERDELTDFDDQDERESVSEETFTDEDGRTVTRKIVRRYKTVVTKESELPDEKDTSQLTKVLGTGSELPTTTILRKIYTTVTKDGEGTKDGLETEQLDELDDQDGKESVTEETFTDEHGRTVTRKIVKRYKTVVTTEGEDVIGDISSDGKKETDDDDSKDSVTEETFTDEEGRTVRRKIVKHYKTTVLKTDDITDKTLSTTELQFDPDAKEKSIAFSSFTTAEGKSDTPLDFTEGEDGKDSIIEETFTGEDGSVVTRKITRQYKTILKQETGSDDHHFTTKISTGSADSSLPLTTTTMTKTYTTVTKQGDDYGDDFSEDLGKAHEPSGATSKTTTTVTTITKRISSKDGEEEITEATTEEVTSEDGKEQSTVTVTTKRDEHGDMVVHTSITPRDKELDGYSIAGPVSFIGSDKGEHSAHSTVSTTVTTSQMTTDAWKTGRKHDSQQCDSDEEDDPTSPLSITSQLAHSPPSHFGFETSASPTASVELYSPKVIPSQKVSSTQMTSSFYGSLPSGEEQLTSTDEKLDFQRALHEHREARGEDLQSSFHSPPVHKTVTMGYKEGLLHGEQLSSGINGQKHEDIDSKGATTKSIPSSSGVSATSQKIPPVVTSAHLPAEHGQSAQKDTKGDKQKDPIGSWGKPLGLPAPAPPPANTITTNGEVNTATKPGTPKKEKKAMQMKKNLVMNENNKAANAQSAKESKSRRSESPVKQKNVSNKDVGKNTKVPGGHIYIDLTYVPHHGNSYYTNVEFFKKVRARYYVFSGTEPSRDVYNALLEAKQTWEDKDLEVTIIPTYDTDTLGYWVAENEDLLTKYKIDLSPSASRCTINLQDHETSCSAYRLEF
ncbi:microtubule-associated protein futsch-like isoform X7 [Schistocerca cancellata]|uniref:microtubule-associated protein futsch-like isoform X7 n=1 Tax=Schistocerca cancellata TaxID=274614 RepID=UPI002119A449|nr:microtubule-associated protein futsch-like isoform X7 [Schistocerca cancellata]